MFIKPWVRWSKNVFIYRQIYVPSCLRQEGTYDLKVLLTSDDEYSKLANHYFQLHEAHRCLVIQPYVKWGPKKLSISPKEQLTEAVALVHTLPAWTVEETLSVPLDTLERKALFKSGNMDKIRSLLQCKNEITAVFVNTKFIKNVSVQILEEHFYRPILDRYNIIMKILKAHATSKHAKLQVALAELYYLRRKSKTDVIFRTYNPEALRLMFQEREQKLKNEITTLRHQRSLLRNKRNKLGYPIVAVVGYTNAGKTSIIKALTGKHTLQPKNQLFSTLDVTLHEGVLPSGLTILYVDTVGFISDIPTDLIECFIATLEDVLLADVILHVEDLSSESYQYKRKHVLDTLKNLELQTDTKDILNKMISVGNKCDLVEENEAKDENLLLVSAEKGIGLKELRFHLEGYILHTTNRQKIKIKIPNGGEEIRWLYKNSTVLQITPDEYDAQLIFAEVIITQANLQKFKHYFI